MFVIFIVIFKGYDSFSTLQVGKAGRTNGRAYATVLRLSGCVKMQDRCNTTQHTGSSRGK